MYIIAMIAILLIAIGLLSRTATLDDSNRFLSDMMAKSETRRKFLEQEVQGLAEDTVKLDKDIQVEHKDDTVRITAKSGKTYRLIELSETSAKEVLHQLSSLDFWKE